MKNVVSDRHFPIEKRNFLIQEYEKQQYPSTEMIQMFANELNLTFKQVMQWFCDRRYKYGHTNVILNDKKGISI
jgi:predicted solute-binding protein